WGALPRRRHRVPRGRRAPRGDSARLPDPETPALETRPRPPGGPAKEDRAAGVSGSGGLNYGRSQHRRGGATMSGSTTTNELAKRRGYTYPRTRRHVPLASAAAPLAARGPGAPP